MDKFADIEIKATSGNIARARFRIENQSLAVGLMWKVPPSQQDILEANAVVLPIIAPELAPGAPVNSVYGGTATEEQQDRLLDRFLKSDLN